MKITKVGKGVGKIKVVEYISNFGDGGAETLVKDYVRLIDHNRFVPIVVALRGEKKSANRRILAENKIPFIAIYPYWNVFVRFWNKLLGWWYIPYRLKKIIRRENVQVLHMHLMVLKDVARIRKSLDGIQLLFTCHNLPENVFGEERSIEQKAAEMLIKDNNLQLIALHNEMAQELNSIFGVNNSEIIWNGIETERFRNSIVSRSEERQKLGICQDAFVVGHVGRFAEQKNHGFLADVFIELVKDRDNAFLLMIGAGDSSQIEEKLRNSGLGNRYLILSQRSDVNEILQAMDVFVFPSRYEGLPVALIEAQYAGLRCIVSDTITREAICTENVIALPLGNPSIWVNAVLDENVKGKAYSDLRLFDMNAVIRRLEMLYSGGMGVNNRR